MAGLKSWLAIIATLLMSAASAQQAPMSEDLAWKLLELGRVIDPPKTAALYAPMQEKEPYAGASRSSATPSTARPNGTFMLWATKNGFVGVNTTYRLAPASPWPAGSEDLASVVKWVSEKIAERGGIPRASI